MQMWTHKYILVIWLKVALGRVPFPSFICKYHLLEIQKHINTWNQNIIIMPVLIYLHSNAQHTTVDEL